MNRNNVVLAISILALFGCATNRSAIRTGLSKADADAIFRNNSVDRFGKEFFVGGKKYSNRQLKDHYKKFGANRIATKVGLNGPFVEVTNSLAIINLSFGLVFTGLYAAGQPGNSETGKKLVDAQLGYYGAAAGICVGGYLFGWLTKSDDHHIEFNQFLLRATRWAVQQE